MSCFQSVDNTVREETNATNKIISASFEPRNAALPFNDGIGRLNYNKSSASGSIENESEDENDDEGYNSNGEGTSRANVTRITTRARITYELDRFQKNAMIMFVQISSNPPRGFRIIELTNQEVAALVKTFTSFRFEVDVHVDLTCSQLDQKCQEFFQRDFSQYGAVVVMVLSFDGTVSELAALDGRFSDSVILRHLTDELNPTLYAKPKIYITETTRSGAIAFKNGRFPHSLPLEEHHRDVLGFHIPRYYYLATANPRRNPLLLLCDNINNMGDSSDIMSILKKTVEDSNSTGLFNDILAPIELNSNLSKELRLVRS